MCILFYIICTESVPIPIELDYQTDYGTYDPTKHSKDDIREALSKYDKETLREVLAEAGLYDVSIILYCVD